MEFQKKVPPEGRGVHPSYEAPLEAEHAEEEGAEAAPAALAVVARARRVRGCVFGG